ncbi:MAG: sigma-70 family RNA polymerase sigma factor [Lachnospiraceae bacterium]|nr:sigma-70 family RNA polymerase sigma factor [Lachnospiraceae bacterium]
MKELNPQYLAGLVIRAGSNDSDAFAELYALTYNKVYNFARHYLRDAHLAHDAMQEVYISALKNINKLSDPTLFIAWLNRITFNVCYDMSQKTNLVRASADPEILEFIQDSRPLSNPEAHYQQKDEYARLHTAMDSLPFQEKQVLTMRYYNNMKLEDIADAMDISRSTVKRYIASGQEHLRNLLKD